MHLGDRVFRNRQRPFQKRALARLHPGRYEPRMMTRKQFLGSLAGLAGLAALGACKKEDGDDVMPDAPKQPMPDAPLQQPDAPVMMACTTAQSMIASNHGHVLTISAADLMAGIEKTYDIRGASAHPHTVTITAAMFAMLKQARTLSVVSSTDANHTHSVTVTC